MKNNKLILTGLLMTLFVTIMIGFTDCKSKKEKTDVVAAIDTANIDKTVLPGVDFYQYSNGNWIKNHPVPDEYSRYGAFDILQEKNYNDLKSILEDASKDEKAEKSSNKRKIGNFYTSGMDTAKIEKDGISPLADEFALIDNIKTIEDFQKEVAHLHTIGIYPLFFIYAAQDEKNSEMVITQLAQGGLGLSDRDYYLSKDPRSQEILEGYKKHVNKMFTLLGNDETKAKAATEEIINIETKLAEVSWTRLELRDPIKGYNKFKLEDLQKKNPNLNWTNYFSNIGLANAGDINVGQPSFFENMSKLLKDISIDSWKTYLRWNLIHGTASFLSSEFENENFDFYGKVMSGKTKMQPRWKRVLRTVSGGMGEAVGQVYVEKFFPAEAKTKMVTLVNNLKTCLSERIENLAWMGVETKKAAKEKLNTMNVKIGYPDVWRDYTKLEIGTESYVKNIMNNDKFEFEFMINKIGKPVDRNEWYMSPQTVNAYYSPTMNEIVFPAGILQPPFFFKDADDAVNYGAIGTVIGHEMTHGFDDQGRQYDKEGNLVDWWTKEDAEKFTKQTAVLVEQYDNFKMLDSLHVDGKLTLGENIADVGGLTVSLNALKSVLAKSGDTTKIDGFTPLQRFFLSYSQVWSQSIRDKELMRRLKEDVHSPGNARVNGAIVNIPEFYDAFSVKESDPMFLKEEKRAKIW